MARRGTRAEQYFAIAAFYGVELIQDLNNPRVPEFVIVHAARRAAHYALTALRLEEQHGRKSPAPALAAPAWAPNLGEPASA